MEVRFRTRQLRACASSSNEATKAFGRAAGRTYIERVIQLMEMESTKEIPASWRFHPLQGKLSGMYALDVNKRKGIRLLVTLPTPNVVVIEKLDSSHYG